MEHHIYQSFVEILQEELVPAMGCTEPIAVAYASALARSTLGTMPEHIRLIVSGNIIKNVKSVIVPHTGGRKGLRTAVCAGVVCGREDRELEVLAQVTPEEILAMDAYMKQVQIEIIESDDERTFDINITVHAGNDEASVRIVDHHTNVVYIVHNNEVILQKELQPAQAKPEDHKRDLLTVERIVEFADTADLNDVRAVLQRQIDCNMAIAERGLRGGWGANIGRILLQSYGSSVQNRAKAWAAAGSDARMSGCELPVVINSGSGNQGMTASIPVIIYARECNVSEDLMMRALLVSNLVTIHLKSGIGSLSAYCGATSAGVGAGAGICYLYGGRTDEIAHTIVNALAINSGMICDGAKASCAAKIASAVEAGLLGWQMNAHDSQFFGGDGIIVKGVENTIRAVSRIARDGMRSTDTEIIRLMISETE